MKCSKVTRDGKELTLAYRGAGECFGELEVFGQEPREEMAEAMKNAIITAVPASLMLEILESTRPPARSPSSRATSPGHGDQTRAPRLSRRSGQLAALLLELADDFGIDQEGGRTIGLKITHLQGQPTGSTPRPF